MQRGVLPALLGVFTPVRSSGQARDQAAEQVSAVKRRVTLKIKMVERKSVHNSVPNAINSSSCLPPFPCPTGAPCPLQITVASTLVAGAIAGVGATRPAPEICIDGSSDEGENVVGSSDETVTKRSRARPDDHEAPLCPSGHFSSKPVRDPSVSPSAPKRAKLLSSPRVEVALLPASSDSSASERKMSPEREGKRRDDGKGREKRPRSPYSGDEKLAKVAKSQTPSSPGEASQLVVTAATVKVVEAETSPCSQKANCSSVASGGSGGGCSTVAESASASLGPSSSPEREEKSGNGSKDKDKRPRSANPGDQKLVKVAKSPALSSPGEVAKAVEAETSPCSQKADSSGAANGDGDGCSTAAESASAEGIKGASPGPSVLEAEEDVGPARVPTEVEKTKLAIMSRQSITVPLRLDAREQ